MTTSSFWSGSVRGVGPSMAQSVSMAAMVAAGNFFDKTGAALARGDEEKARRLATQTAQRPFDDHEGEWPGPAAAHFAIFQLVTDMVEEWPQDDHTWVDALAGLASRVSGRQLDELRHLAAILHQDAQFLGVHQEEAEALLGLARGADPKARPSHGVAEADRPGYVLEMAHLLLDVQADLDRGRR